MSNSLPFRLLGLTLVAGFQAIYPPAARALTQPPPSGQILQVQGEAKLLRNQGFEVPVTVGMILYPGDRLQIQVGSQVRLQCADLSLPLLSGRPQPVGGCLASKPKPRCSPGVLRCPRRIEGIAQNLSDIPFLISPRKTAIFSDRPHLRWHPVPGATTYTVRLQGADIPDWQTTVTSPEVTYDGAPLQPGSYYLWSVETDTGKFSRSEESSNLGIQRLDRASQQRLQQVLQPLQALPLDADGLALGLAAVYRQFELYADAIAVLEQRVAQGNAATAVYHLLAELYRQVELAILAVPTYQQAIARGTPQDRETAVVAGIQLAELYEEMGDVNGAIATLHQALQQTETLQDQARSRDLTEKLQQLKTRN